ILVIDGQHPARAKRIKYYEDARLRHMFEGQTGDYPLPLGGKLNAQDAAEIDDRMAAIVQRQTEGMIVAQRVGSGSVAASAGEVAPPKLRKAPRASASLMTGLLDISDFDAAKAPRRLLLPDQPANSVKHTPALQMSRRGRMSSSVMSKAQLIAPTAENCAEIESITQEIEMIRKQGEAA
ncbi:MAG: hypothetical protein EA386_16275, partial [Rhodobacteraceae bacterium]